jgi:hypothetical protein
VCKEAGDLICCNNCPRSFHLEKCLNRYCTKHKLTTQAPPPSDKEEWFCPKCKPIIEKRKKDQEAKKLTKDAKEKASLGAKERKAAEAASKKEEFEKKRIEKKIEKGREKAEKLRVREAKLAELKAAREEKESRIKAEKEERER